MPHISIKMFPGLDQDQKQQLTDSMVQLIMESTQCPENVVSVAIETIEKEHWDNNVYQLEIVQRREFLTKAPNYNLDTATNT